MSRGAVGHLLQFFDYAHLPSGPMLETSKRCADLAHEMAEDLDYSGLELEAGLRHLLEAKDCFVRQALLKVGGRGDGL